MWGAIVTGGGGAGQNTPYAVEQAARSCHAASAKQIEEFSRRDNRNAAKCLEGLKMLLIPGHQEIRLSSQRAL